MRIKNKEFISSATDLKLWIAFFHAGLGLTPLTSCISCPFCLLFGLIELVSWDILSPQVKVDDSSPMPDIKVV